MRLHISASAKIQALVLVAAREAVRAVLVAHHRSIVHVSRVHAAARHHTPHLVPAAVLVRTETLLASASMRTSDDTDQWYIYVLKMLFCVL